MKEYFKKGFAFSLGMVCANYVLDYTLKKIVKD